MFIRMFLLSLLLSLGTGQTTPPSPNPSGFPILQSPRDKLEETVLTSMLKMIDEKFNTLNGRIGQIERAVNGLQFFSIRKFRELSNTLQTSSSLTQAVHSQLGNNDLETRNLKATVSRVSHDVVKLKESNSKLSQKLDRSILYINRNIEEKANDIISSLESIEAKREEEAGLLAEAALEQEFISRKETAINCTFDVKNLEEQIDDRFNLLRNQSHYQFEKLRNQSEVHFNKLKFQSKQQFDTVRSEANTHHDKQTHLSNVHFDTLKNQSQGYYDNLKRQWLVQYSKLSNLSLSLRVEKESEENDVVEGGVESEESKETNVFIDNEGLYLALANMTSNIVQAVSFIRHTEGMIERVISNTDDISYEQEQLRKEITSVLASQPISSGGTNPDNTVVMEGGTKEAQVQDQERRLETQTTGCSLPESVLNDIAKFSKNGSQLFEILTDLAQMSQVSLSSSIVELQDEVVRMEESRTKADAETKLPASYAPGDYNLVLQKIHNTTKNTFKMAEAMASNTGWIPYIFHNVQYLEGQMNRSMTVTNRFLSEIRGLQSKLARADPNAHTQGSVFNVPKMDERRNGSSKTNENTLESIYDTSLKLKRIMPALTRLIAEPEPLITLVDGRKANEGRVEIYHQGQWGTICNKKLGHVEAAAICRHLGFVGGISAGGGQFGPGEGVTWSFNLTCLRTQQCSSVSGGVESSVPETCSHRNDFAVICDHMLRLVAIDGSNDVNTGHIEIYQNSRWRPVCAHGFGRNEAQVSCRQMGYTTGWNRDFRGRLRNEVSVWMTNVQCRGSETRLTACRHNVFGKRPCTGLKPATVTCE